jgi:hypothetical protein
MIIFWRGVGFLVFFVPFAWIFLLVGIMIGIGSHEPDPHKATVFVHRLFALAFALSAVTLDLVSRYRSRAAPGRDEFMFIPMRYWSWVVAAGAVALFVASFLAVP